MNEQGLVLLQELVSTLTHRVIYGDLGSVTIRAISADSRVMGPDSLFVAIPGDTVDGHDFIGAAVKNGAVAVLVEEGRVPLKQDQGSLDAVIVEVVDTQEALGILASRFYGLPSENMTMIGITGTNGKTTVSYLIEHVLAKAGFSVGVIGTVTYRYTDRNGFLKEKPAGFTTPDPVELYRYLKEMQDHGVSHVIMEVSSHALAQKRLGPLLFDLAVFTNLSQDHLDYHGSMEDYFSAKRLLFEEKLKLGSWVVLWEPDESNLEKRFWTERVKAVCRKYKRAICICGESEQSDFQMVSSRVDRSGTLLDFKSGNSGIMRITSPLIGTFNGENLMVSIAALVKLGLNPPLIGSALENAHGAPGRMERVPMDPVDKPLPAVIVDYAHTPDALKNVLETAKTLPHRNLICVFGCGGDRDRSKRPQMGEVAASLADIVIITDDNPRSEDPGAIRNDIISSKAIGRNHLKSIQWLASRRDFERGCLEIDGRAEAIGVAIYYGSAEDIVIIAGKGHENYQITTSGKAFFDDRLVALESALRWDVDTLAAGSGGTIVQPGSGGQLNRVSTDTRLIAENDIFVALSGENFDGHDFVEQAVEQGASCIVVSEDQSELEEACGCVRVDNTLDALGNLAGYRRQLLKQLKDPLVIGITGSCGKTTVKEMTASIFSTHWPEQPDFPPARVLKTEGNFNNLIGLPLSLLPASIYQEALVLEMGMNQPGEIGRLAEIGDPDIACITNVHAAHLEGLGTIENVARAKGELFEGVRSDCTLIINLDDEHVVALSQKYPGKRKITYGITPQAIAQKPDVWATEIKADSFGRVSFVLHLGGEQERVVLQSPGLHNCSNSCAAAAISKAAGIALDSIIRGLETFVSTQNRMQVLMSPQGLNILNDTYNANPASMSSALDTLDTVAAEQKVAILGDMLELGADAAALHQGIGAYVARLKIGYLAVYGPLARNIAESAVEHGMKSEQVHIFEDKQRVVDWVAELLHTEQLHHGDWVLVKASRGLALDSVVDQLMADC